MLRIAACLAVCITWACCATDAPAQEASVRTLTYDLREAKGGSRSRNQNEPIGRSLSLFHAGKVYDDIEALGEITIFEPAQQQFTIINRPRMMVTTLSFNEIERELFRAQQKAEQYLSDGEQKTDAAFLRAAASVTFQLRPVFQEHIDLERKRVRLTSSHLSYDVECADKAPPELVAAYLQYATWAARLNYLLHPQGLFPNPRIALNDVLRSRQLLPTRVELHTGHKEGLHLRAEHRYSFNLDSANRRRIQFFEAELTNPALKSFGFEEYQRILLTSSKQTARR